MAELSADYAGPSLRWALLLEDHPGATHKFELRTGAELEIPEEWGRDQDFCVATITFPPASGLAPVTASKAVNEALEVERWVQEGGRKTKKKVTLDKTPELWNKLTTMTLGRALKRAGYPDDLQELKALIVWRRRLAEMSALAIGPSVESRDDGAEPDFDQAGKATAEHVGEDDAAQPPVIDLDSTEKPAADGQDEEPDDLLGEVRSAFGALSGTEQKVIRALAKQHGVNVGRPDTASAATWLLGEIAKLGGHQPTRQTDDEGEGEDADVDLGYGG